ncbi:DUF89 family protein [Candidatus Bathyarchaeota archaeon]|nr:DUF89 family protein [Candidatus Bathyarchaeota archaeon]
MKINSHCGYCLLHRGYKIIERSTDDEVKRLTAMESLFKLMNEKFNSEAVPSFLGAERCRILRKVTCCDDPYAELKKESNLKALEILPKMEEYIKNQPKEERFRATLKVACIGNVIEFDVPGHNSDIIEALKGLDEGFYIDDTKKLEKLLVPETKVLYLTDNAGEIAFDKLVVKELKHRGCLTTVAVKGGPGLNDALMDDAIAVSMLNEAFSVITTGTDAIGINLKETSKEFNDVFFSTNIIIAKGMANWETLTEVEAPCKMMYIFRTKCVPVALTVGAPLNVNIAKLVNKGWKL